MNNVESKTVGRIWESGGENISCSGLKTNIDGFGGQKGGLSFQEGECGAKKKRACML
jgi:hypothetical protein